jgi:hypothetical protein
VKYPAGISGEEYAAMEEGYEQGRAAGLAERDALRERLEAIVRDPQADLYRDEATRHAVAQPYADNRYVRLLDDVRAVLDAERR